MEWPVPCKQIARRCASMLVMLLSNEPRRRDLWGAVSKEVALFYKKIFLLVINCFSSHFTLAQQQQVKCYPNPKQRL